uniref:Hyaluronidase n=1 Tax=Scleropages formosus TaxID=113540 RepID=A0A8C9TYX3_SCLFO
MDLLIHMRGGGFLLLTTVTLSFLAVISFALPSPPTASPLFHGYPFVVIWNMPTPVCKIHNITLDTSPFQAVTTPASVPDQFLVLFYRGRLGLYPYVDTSTGQQFNGGIPQKGNLTESLNIAFTNIEYYIPSETSPGLAVIDWEGWRPLWHRNWDSKEIYQKLSIAYTRELDANLTAEQAVIVAKEQFEKAARDYMEDTLELGITERPQYLWGFYLFPDCYNYDWDTPGYTGECSAAVKSQNDELLWLWETSTALYPSVYLDSRLSNNHSAALFVRNQVQEAVRVAALPQHPFTAPIYVYSRPVFSDLNKEFLSNEDLVSTIGESAALGASGSVLWGASADFRDQALSAYLTSTLNPYIANVTAAAKLCSTSLCQGNGRCVRKDYDSDSYLHLNPNSFTIHESNGKYQAVGVPSLSDLTAFADSFTCQCYAGKSCSPRLPTQLPMTPLPSASSRPVLHADVIITVI